MANVRNSWTSHNRLLGAGAASHTPMPLSLRSRLDQLRWTRAILELNLLFMDCVSISSIPLFLLSWFYALICNSTNCHNLPKNSSMEERIQRTWIFENYFSIVTHSIVFFATFHIECFSFRSQCTHSNNFIAIFSPLSKIINFFLSLVFWNLTMIYVLGKWKQRSLLGDDCNNPDNE